MAIQRGYSIRERLARALVGEGLCPQCVGTTSGGRCVDCGAALAELLGFGLAKSLGSVPVDPFGTGDVGHLTFFTGPPPAAPEPIRMRVVKLRPMPFTVAEPGEPIPGPPPVLELCVRYMGPGTVRVEVGGRTPLGWSWLLVREFPTFDPRRLSPDELGRRVPDVEEVGPGLLLYPPGWRLAHLAKPPGG